MHGNVSLDRMALVATAHCFTGCAIGEVAGLAIATALGWGVGGSIALAVALAFAFGYAFTTVPLFRSGLPLRTALGIALAADTVSVGIMELVDNTVIASIPGAMDAGLGDGRFWWSLALGLALAFIAALPVNRALIARGRGHAVAHAQHRGSSASDRPGLQTPHGRKQTSSSRRAASRCGRSDERGSARGSSVSITRRVDGALAAGTARLAELERERLEEEADAPARRHR